MAQSREQNKSTETISEKAQMSDLLDKDFKTISLKRNYKKEPK